MQLTTMNAQDIPRGAVFEYFGELLLVMRVESGPDSPVVQLRCLDKTGNGRPTNHQPEDELEVCLP